MTGVQCLKFVISQIGPQQIQPRHGIFHLKPKRFYFMHNKNKIVLWVNSLLDNSHPVKQHIQSHPVLPQSDIFHSRLVNFYPFISYIFTNLINSNSILCFFLVIIFLNILTKSDICSCSQKLMAYLSIIISTHNVQIILSLL